MVLISASTAADSVIVDAMQLFGVAAAAYHDSSCGGASGGDIACIHSAALMIFMINLLLD
jgi:hypothetical protein